MEAGFGDRTLGRGHLRARRVVALARGLRRVLERLQALHDVLDLLRARLERVLRLLHLEALASLFLVDLGELGADRLAAPFGLLRALRELEVLDLHRVVLLARGPRFLAQAPRLVLGRAQALLQRVQPCFHLGALARARRDAAVQLLDLALALQHAVQLGLRAVEYHALAAEEVATARDQ